MTNSTRNYNLDGSYSDRNTFGGPTVLRMVHRPQYKTNGKQPDIQNNGYPKGSVQNDDDTTKEDCTTRWDKHRNLRRESPR